MKTFAVIGLGAFGLSVASSLTAMGYEVLGIDKDEEIVRRNENIATHIACADCTDESVLRKLGLDEFDVAVVAMGDEDIQSGILITVMLKELGVKTIAAKAKNLLHRKILLKVGADTVFLPEVDMGIRAGHMLARKGVKDFEDLSEKHAIAELTMPPMWVGKSLLALDLTKNLSLVVVAIRQNDTGELIVPPHASYVMRKQDNILIAGERKRIFDLTLKD